MPQYDVLLFPSIHLKPIRVEACNQREAVRKAYTEADLYSAVQPYEWDESCYMQLVDEVGDEEYRRSQWYVGPETPFRHNLQRLVSALEHDRQTSRTFAALMGEDTEKALAVAKEELEAIPCWSTDGD